MPPLRSLQDVLVMRSPVQKTQDLCTARVAALRNALSSPSAIARQMSIENYHCRYAKHFFDKSTGKKIIPATMEHLDSLWMFHKPYGCDRVTSLDPTIVPPVKDFVDGFVRKEHAKNRNCEKSIRVLYDLPAKYSGIVLCKWMPRTMMKTDCIRTLPLGIEVLFHCLYPYMPRYHDTLFHKTHRLDIPMETTDTDIMKVPQAIAQIVSIGTGTDSLRYWLSTKKVKGMGVSNRYVLLEVSVPILGGKTPCLERLLTPLMNVGVLSFPRTMIHAVKLSADVIDHTSTVQMSTSAIGPGAPVESNRAPSFPKYYLTQKSFGDSTYSQSYSPEE
ncbi:hypothetical protein XU18_4807 [Perkinsela sp. CCAP 1560/4]|nr:hypothetical protein XU18_4807 [Perkinsela sp. CCAP 1560/4]|eukprot:KNH03853.1 hypothetical protein XU18_4807 [Perkinsela sp. CCAP 1560/4]